MKDKITIFTLWSIMAIVMSIVLFVACDHLYNKYNLPHDSLPEELVEGYIEKQTGVEIDFTPESPEKPRLEE